MINHVLSPGIQFSIDMIDRFYTPIQQPKEQEKEKTAEGSNFGNNNHLKPCPFCAGTEKDHVVILGYKSPYYRVTCCNCNVVLEDDRKDKVQGKWNDRNGLSWDKADYLTLENTVSELEARVKELEGALKQLADATTNWPYGHSIPEMAKIATNALKTNTNE